MSNSENHLLSFTLHLADSSLIMGHRLSEWAAHGPTLEQDIAISNIALDLIGQSRNFYQYAAQLSGDRFTEDSLAYLRDDKDFKNLLIAELPNNDWAYTILKIYFFSSYQSLLYERLLHSGDKQIAAIAEKSLKEVTYHIRWSSEWVLRMGDGTEESRKRISKALLELYPFTSEMFVMTDYETTILSPIPSFDIIEMKNDWMENITEILEEATLSIPSETTVDYEGKMGKHTEYLTSILEEMQELQRAFPGCEW